jgi:hypothetical protein
MYIKENLKKEEKKSIEEVNKIEYKEERIQFDKSHEGRIINWKNLLK